VRLAPALLLLALACSPAAGPATVNVDTAVEEKAPDDSYRLAWISQGERGGELLAVAPWGDVVTVHYEAIAVLSRQDGELLDSATCCRDARALGFVDDQRAILVRAGGQLMEVRFPGVVVRTLKRIEEVEVARAAVTRGAIALAGGGRLVVLALPGFTARLDEKLDGDAESLALSEDGSLVAVATEEHGTRVYDVTSGKLLVRRPEEMTALSIAPDNSEVFGSTRDGAVAFDAKSAETRREYPDERSFEATRYVSASLTVAVTYDGMKLFSRSRGAPESFMVALDEEQQQKLRSLRSVGASQDGALVCGGAPYGEVVCFSNKSLGASGYVKPPSLVPSLVEEPPEEKKP
jgi:hypothetical protein